MSTNEQAARETGKELVQAIASTAANEIAPDEGHCQVNSTVTDERFESLMESAIDGIIVIDEKAKIISYNRACESLFGHSAQEIKGQSVNVIMPADFAKEHDKCVANYVNGGPPKILGMTREAYGLTKDGEEVPIEVVVGEARTEEGRQFIGIIRDLRPRRDSEERVRILQSQLFQMARVSAINEMGSALAHELNQPLTAIMLYLQIVHRKAKDKTSLGEAEIDVIEKAVKESERAGKTIKTLRNFIEKRETIKKWSSLARLINETIELVHIGHKSRNVEILMQVPEDLPDIMVDRVQIQQILVNLLKNAFEVVETEDEKWIKITGRHEDNCLVVDIQDSGPGIPPEFVGELFNVFSTSKTKGVGLGLAISKGIAQNHGGNLKVDPGGEGKGAVFTLNLPISEKTE